MCCAKKNKGIVKDVYLRWMLAKPILCGSHFTIYVIQSIMLYTLNLHSDVFQLFLTKTGGKCTYNRSM